MYLIVIPVWGERHRDIFLNYGVKSLLNALKERPARFLIRTDACWEVKEALAPYPVDARAIEGHSYNAFCLAHKEGLAEAEVGTRVVTPCADHIFSNNFFDGLDRHFDSGAELVVMSGFRTNWADVKDVPTDAPPRELLRWGLEHRHPITEGLFFGRGGTCTPSSLMFEKGDTVIHRGFHLHPMACVKRGVITGGGGVNKTIDEYLMDNYSREDIHVVTDADDIAVIEVTGPDREFNGGVQTVDSVAAWARTQATNNHRWLFTHRMVMRGGDEDPGDIPVCNAILSALNYFPSDFGGSPEDLPKLGASP